ncbi:MAG TPA: cupin domain-containing protein [Burkholderiales bacterium]|nr:cupin domain-containing protein [Burkholderiales bacterium]
MSEPYRPLKSKGLWEGVEVLRYKEEGTAPFKDITRQTLFDNPELGCQLRYFEVAPHGYSTLERHEHSHAVLVLNGQGRCLIGNRVFEVRGHDLVQIPSMTWHQFRADTEALGFLCMVNRERDRPQLPTDEDLKSLRAQAHIAEFMRW